MTDPTREPNGSDPTPAQSSARPTENGGQPWSVRYGPALGISATTCAFVLAMLAVAPNSPVATAAVAGVIPGAFALLHRHRN